MYEKFNSRNVNFHKKTFPFEQDSSIQIDPYNVFPQVISDMDPLDEHYTYPPEATLLDSSIQLDEIRRYSRLRKQARFVKDYYQVQAPLSDSILQT